MPLNGNRLGSKEKFLYITDKEDTAYIMRRDTDLAISGFGVGTNAPVPFDGSTLPDGVTSATPRPVNFKPRVVHVEDPVSGARKSMICFDPSASLYAAVVSQTVNIDGLDFVTTGRTGESLSF